MKKKRWVFIPLAAVVLSIIGFAIFKHFYEKPHTLHYENIPLHETYRYENSISNNHASVDISMIVGRKLFEKGVVLIHEGRFSFNDDFTLPEDLRAYQSEWDAFLQGSPFSRTLSFKQDSVNFSNLFSVNEIPDEPSSKTKLLGRYSVFLLLGGDFWRDPHLEHHGSIELYISSREGSVIVRHYTCDLRDLTAELKRLAR